MKYIWSLLLTVNIVIFWLWYAFQEKFAKLSQRIPSIDQINSWQSWLVIVGFAGMCLLVIAMVFKNKKIALITLVIEVLFVSYIVTAKATTVDQNDSQYYQVSAKQGKYEKITTEKLKALTSQNNKYLVYVYTDKSHISQNIKAFIKQKGYVLRIYKVKPNTNLSTMILDSEQPNPLIIKHAALIVAGQESIVKIEDKQVIKTITTYYQ